MNIIIVFFIVFIAAGYMLIYLRRSKKDKADNVNSVEEYHRNYTEHREELRKRRNTALKTKNYVTKFNSSEDFREK